MYSDDDLNRAIDAGILTTKDVERFRQFIIGTHDESIINNEPVQLLNDFNDFFVLIASIITLLALFTTATMINDLFAYSVLTICIWGLCELFLTYRRMTLLAIVLLLSFVSTGFGVGWQLAQLGFTAHLSHLLTASGCAIFAAILHGWRFRIPITAAISAGLSVLIFILVVMMYFPQHKTLINCALLVSGVGVFILAMHYDITDISRVSWRADIAFWLHLLAAPLIVHSSFSLIGLDYIKSHTTGMVIALLFYIFLGMISLLVERRALLVAALFYAIYALSGLLRSYGTVQFNVTLSALCSGVLLLLLALFWHRCRSMLMQYIPHSLQRLLPQPRSPRSKR